MTKIHFQDAIQSAVTDSVTEAPSQNPRVHKTQWWRTLSLFNSWGMWKPCFEHFPWVTRGWSLCKVALVTARQLSFLGRTKFGRCAKISRAFYPAALALASRSPAVVIAAEESWCVHVQVISSLNKVPSSLNCCSSSVSLVSWLPFTDCPPAWQGHQWEADVLKYSYSFL